MFVRVRNSSHIGKRGSMEGAEVTLFWVGTGTIPSTETRTYYHTQRRIRCNVELVVWSSVTTGCSGQWRYRYDTSSNTTIALFLENDSG